MLRKQKRLLILELNQLLQVGLRGLAHLNLTIVIIREIVIDVKGPRLLCFELRSFLAFLFDYFIVSSRILHDKCILLYYLFHVFYCVLGGQRFHEFFQLYDLYSDVNLPHDGITDHFPNGPHRIYVL